MTRPRSVLGHEDAKAVLKSIRARSLLFVGPSSTGRRLIAEWYASYLNCENRDAPCGHCSSCQRFPSDHPDFLVIAPGETTSGGRLKRRREIRIGQLVSRTGEDNQPLSHWLEQRPLFKHKVGVIDQAETLTLSAANAFLKMLEEPPSYTSIILIAPSPQAILPTLASRCTVVRFGTVDTDLYRDLAPHPDLRLGRIGKLETARQDLDNFRELQHQVHDFVLGLSKDLAISLEAAETLQKAWDNTEESRSADLLREELRGLPAKLYAQAEDALARFEEALSAYVSAELAVSALTLELRSLFRSAGYKAG